MGGAVGGEWTGSGAGHTLRRRWRVDQVQVEVKLPRSGWRAPDGVDQVHVESGPGVGGGHTAEAMVEGEPGLPARREDERGLVNERGLAAPGRGH